MMIREGEDASISSSTISSSDPPSSPTTRVKHSIGSVSSSDPLILNNNKYTKIKGSRASKALPDPPPQQDSIVPSRNLSDPSSIASSSSINHHHSNHHHQSFIINTDNGTQQPHALPPVGFPGYNNKSSHQQQQQSFPNFTPYLPAPPPQSNSLSPTPGNHNSLGRKRTLVRPDRRKSLGEGGDPTSPPLTGSAAAIGSTNLRRRPTLGRETSAGRRDLFNSLGRHSNEKKEPQGPKVTPWVIASRILTCCIPFNRNKDLYVQQAFREKVALCIIIFIMMLVVGFLTFGFQNAVCVQSNPVQYAQLGILNGVIAIHGIAWSLNNAMPHPNVYGKNINQLLVQSVNTDLSSMFPPSRSAGSTSACMKLNPVPHLTCNATNLGGTPIWPNSAFMSPSDPLGVDAGCHWVTNPIDLSKYLDYQGVLVADWSVVQNTSNLMVYSGHVLDLNRLFRNNNFLTQFQPKVISLARKFVNQDATLAFASAGLVNEARCLVEHFKVAEVDNISSGCLVSQVIVTISFIVILIVILARFVLAMFFTYFIGWRLGDNSANDLRRRRQEYGRVGEAKPVGLDRRDHPYGGPELRKRSSSNTLGGDDSDRQSMVSTSVVARKPTEAREAARRRELERDMKEPSRRWSANFGFMEFEGGEHKYDQSVLNDPSLMHTLVMVPCYSEGEASVKATLNSIAHSYYPSTHKVLFVIADGIVKGKDNAQTTPDILIDMIDVDRRFRHEDPKWGGEPPKYSYVAIADGVNRKNYARVYAGWYKYDLTDIPEVGDKRQIKRAQRAQTRAAAAQSIVGAANGEDEDDSSPAYLKTLKQRSQGRVPMLLIVKCGNDEEAGSAKPGNRGKRDSQVILMNFLCKVMFDDRMTELEFDIFFKLFTITGVNPDKYECVLMVDADTRIYPDSLTHMVACMLKDDRIMGLCGETKISNKWDSWVTMIQVFEYFISHHLAKSFESVFGGVTCLPGCFSMYRIKTPKGPNGYWVPILANPDVVEEYSENIVDTLHKKNLLLLGEDRFLTTMMLRAFPKRRMVFCPPAICKTVVPETFKVLLSQRRRWINSTIHNLMELLLVKDLCGTFCISMQFVIFMELVGTVVLPAAISFTLTLLVLFFAKIGDTTLPLILLAIILGLPAVLIVFTANRVIYVFWMFIYLLSLPIWNFVLPLYAFWHFDDFSWGETRRVMGEVKGHDHSARDGEFDGTGINMKRWSEWVQVRKQQHENAERARLGLGTPLVLSSINNSQPRHSTIGSSNTATLTHHHHPVGAPVSGIPGLGVAGFPPGVVPGMGGNGSLGRGMALPPTMPHHMMFPGMPPAGAMIPGPPPMVSSFHQQEAIKRFSTLQTPHHGAASGRVPQRNSTLQDIPMTNLNSSQQQQRSS